MRFNTSSIRQYVPQTAETVTSEMFSTVDKAFPGSEKVSRKSWRKAVRDTLDALSLNYEMRQGVYTVYAPLDNARNRTSDNRDDYAVVCHITHDGTKGNVDYVLPKLTAKATKK